MLQVLKLNLNHMQLNFLLTKLTPAAYSHVSLNKEEQRLLSSHGIDLLRLL